VKKCKKGNIDMVEIKWNVVDKISNLSVEEFDHKRNGYLGGHFLLTVNQNQTGDYSQELIDANYPEGVDDILYWLNKLSEGIYELKRGNSFRFPLISLNLCTLIMEKKDTKIKITDILTLVGEPGIPNKFKILWGETVAFKEFEDEVYRSGKELLAWIYNQNLELMEAEDVKSLNRYLTEIEGELTTDENSTTV